MFKTNYIHRISYGETDMMGVTYYGNYFHIFERARNQFFRDRNSSYVRMEKEGFYLPVKSADCQYKKFTVYDQEICVIAWVSKLRNASLHFSYEVVDNITKEICATGNTVHACTDKQGKPVKIPDWVKQLVLKE